MCKALNFFLMFVKSDYRNANFVIEISIPSFWLRNHISMKDFAIKRLIFKDIEAQLCSPLTLKSEPSDGVGSSPSRTPPFERHDKGSRTQLGLFYLCNFSTGPPFYFRSLCHQFLYAQTVDFCVVIFSNPNSLYILCLPPHINKLCFVNIFSD